MDIMLVPGRDKSGSFHTCPSKVTKENENRNRIATRWRHEANIDEVAAPDLKGWPWAEELSVSYARSDGQTTTSTAESAALCDRQSKAIVSFPPSD
jgi:hypothetical protein